MQKAGIQICHLQFGCIFHLSYILIIYTTLRHDTLLNWESLGDSRKEKLPCATFVFHHAMQAFLSFQEVKFKGVSTKVNFTSSTLGHNRR